MANPYQTLGVPRDASETDIKKAYRKLALQWHPDRNPKEKHDEAQKKFSEASNAYDILSDPQKRQEFDQFGRVGGAQGPNGANGGFPGGFSNIPPEEAERILRQAFGEQFGQQFGPNGWAQMFQGLQMQQHMHGQAHPSARQGCNGRREPPRGHFSADMEVHIRRDIAKIHEASRESRIDTDFDERRACYAGKLATITKVDPSDRSLKLRVMVSPGRADELWYGLGAVWDPRDLEPDAEVIISPIVDEIHAASRKTGIDKENDDRRARCAGKLGTVLRVDRADRSVKVRAVVQPGRADELWFGIGAVDLLPQSG